MSHIKSITRALIFQILPTRYLTLGRTYTFRSCLKRSARPRVIRLRRIGVLWINIRERGISRLSRNFPAAKTNTARTSLVTTDTILANCLFAQSRRAEQTLPRGSAKLGITRRNTSWSSRSVTSFPESTLHLDAVTLGTCLCRPHLEVI